MADPVPMRPSSSVAFRIAEAVGSSLMSLIGGAAMFVPGILWFIDELKDANGCGVPLHISHISFAVALMVAGAIFVNPPFGKQLTSIFVTVFPNGLPMLGGSRAGDPQPPAGDKAP